MTRAIAAPALAAPAFVAATLTAGWRDGHPGRLHGRHQSDGAR